MNAVENFGDTPDDFDLDAWIESASRPRREVTIYRDWSLLAEYDRLVAESGKPGDDEAMGDAGIGERIADVLERMEASKLVFTVEALTREERKELAEQAPVKMVAGPDGKEREKVDEVALGDMTVAKAIIHPEVTAEQIGKMRGKLGDGPLNSLYQAVAELNTAGQVLPGTPTSREH